MRRLSRERTCPSPSEPRRRVVCRQAVDAPHFWLVALRWLGKDSATRNPMLLFWLLGLLWLRYALSSVHPHTRELPGSVRFLFPRAQQTPNFFGQARGVPVTGRVEQFQIGCQAQE